MSLAQETLDKIAEALGVKEKAEVIETEKQEVQEQAPVEEIQPAEVSEQKVDQVAKAIEEDPPSPFEEPVKSSREQELESTIEALKDIIANQLDTKNQAKEEVKAPEIKMPETKPLAHSPEAETNDIPFTKIGNQGSTIMDRVYSYINR